MLNALHPGKIQETTKATQAEAVAGADNRKYMTPLRTKQVVDVVVDDVVEGALPAAIDAAIEAASPVFDDVLSAESVESLPNPGAAGKLYIVGKLSYHWNGTGYDQLGVADTDELSEGTTNLYFTEARAKSALADELSEIGSDITELTDSLAAESQARADADASLQVTAAARYQLPIPEVIFQRWGDAGTNLETRLPAAPIQLLNPLPATPHSITLRNASFTGQLPLVRAHGLPAELLSSRRLFLEFVIFRGKKQHVPTAHYADGSWPLPWPVNSRSRGGDQGTGPFRSSIDRPNHLEITTPGQTLPAWRCLNGRLTPKGVQYVTATEGGTITLPAPTFSSNGGQWNKHRAYGSEYTLLKFAYRFLLWDPAANGGRGEHITGPLSRPIVLRHHIWPFLLDHHASSVAREPRCTLAPSFNPYLMTCDFAQ